MNVMLPSSNKTWLPLVTGAALIVLLAGLWILAPDAPSTKGASADAPPPPVEIPEAVIEQVPWKVTAFPAGVGKPTKKQRMAVRKNESRAGGPVMQVVDALLFEPQALGALSGRAATSGAARALARSNLVPKDLKDVKIIRRVAQVGIDIDGVKRAAAEVMVGYKGSLKGKEVRMTLTAALWLERSKQGWKVVAFQGDSQPYKAPPKKENKTGKTGNKGKKS